MEPGKKTIGIIAAVIIIPLAVVFVLLVTLGALLVSEGAQVTEEAETEVSELDVDDSAPTGDLLPAGPKEIDFAPSPQPADMDFDTWYAMWPQEFAEFRESLSDEEWATYNEDRWPESIWPREENFAPVSPEYADCIVWHSESKAALGHGWGGFALKRESEEPVFAYDKPSFSAKVVDEVVTADPYYENCWQQVDERYQTELEKCFGWYSVQNDGYTWSLFELYGDEIVRAWIAIEQIDFHGI